MAATKQVKELLVKLGSLRFKVSKIGINTFELCTYCVQQQSGIRMEPEQVEELLVKLGKITRLVLIG